MTALLTVADVAERLRVSARTVRRLLDTGALPAVRLGRLVRIDPADLAVLTHTHKARPVPETLICRSTNVAKPIGWILPSPTASAYASLLGLETAATPSSSTTNSKPTCGGKPRSANVRPIAGRTPPRPG